MESDMQSNDKTYLLERELKYILCRVTTTVYTEEYWSIIDVKTLINKFK